MHINDIIMTVLTPGSNLNDKGKVWRSIKTLCAFTGLAHADVLGVLNGDLNGQIAFRAGKKGLMIAVKANVPAPAPKPAVVVKAQGGNAHVQPKNIVGGVLGGIPYKVVGDNPIPGEVPLEAGDLGVKAAGFAAVYGNAPQVEVKHNHEGLQAQVVADNDDEAFDDEDEDEGDDFDDDNE
jgi:hypothetical protein